MAYEYVGITYVVMAYVGIAYVVMACIVVAPCGVASLIADTGPINARPPARPRARTHPRTHPPTHRRTHTHAAHMMQVPALGAAVQGRAVLTDLL